MGLLKPLFLRNATSAADVQKLMKADLKNSAGKKGLKFIAAKNVKIGGKAINLFIVTDTPAPFETVIKDVHPAAYRAKGTCDVVKDKESGATQVQIVTAVGQLLPDAVAKLLPEAVGRDNTFEATVAKPSDKLGDVPTLRPTAKPKERGVGEWAKEDYRTEAKRTVMASMTSDGKIGSVYFSDGNRIRTTHGVGPAKEHHAKERSVQFNVNEAQAQIEYDDEGSPDDFDTWLQKRLLRVTKSSVPAWAKLLDSPEKAHDRSEGNPTGSETLIEIFKSINGKLEGWHPSRGTAVKFETDKQTVAVLEAGIKAIDAKFPKPNDHEDLDDEIVERRQEIQEQFQSDREAPSEAQLKALYRDKVIAQRMQALGLDEPTIDELDDDQVSLERINRIFGFWAGRAQEDDQQIKERLEEIEEIRRQRNEAFYDFVKSRLPNSGIVKAMRHPSSV